MDYLTNMWFFAFVAIYFCRWRIVCERCERFMHIEFTVKCKEYLSFCYGYRKQKKKSALRKIREQQSTGNRQGAGIGWHSGIREDRRRKDLRIN